MCNNDWRVRIDDPEVYNNDWRVYWIGECVLMIGKWIIMIQEYIYNNDWRMYYNY